jgi:DNA gyrase subunit A
MATNIPPHTLGEIADAILLVVARWRERDSITTDELMALVPGPDFPTGGVIYRYREVSGDVRDTIRRAYDEGRGQIVVQARMHLEEIGGGKSNVVITELPYGVQKATVLERIAKEVKDGRIAGITDLRDESDYDTGMRVVVEVSRTAKPQAVMADLLKYSQLQETFGANHLALVPTDDGVSLRPRRLSLLEMLTRFVGFRLEVIERRTRHELEKRRARLHIVEGLLVALDRIDEVVAIIRGSKDPEIAQSNLQAKLKLSELQAQAILDMPLRRLTSLETGKLLEEAKELRARIRYLEGLLATEAARLDVVAGETSAIKSAHATPRRSVIIDSERSAAGTQIVMESDLRMPEARQVVLVTTGGVERRDAAGFRYARTDGMTSRATTAQLLQVRAEPKDELFFVSSRGRGWRNPVGFVPEKALFEQLGLQKGEAIVGAGVFPPADRLLVAATRAGRIKRTAVADLGFAAAQWVTVVGLPDADDEVLVAAFADDAAEVVFATAGGLVLRTSAGDVNPQASGSARGVAGIALRKGDRLVAAAVVAAGDVEKTQVFVISEEGYAKRIPLAEYPKQGRAGQGVQTLRITPTTGGVAAVAFGNPEDGLDVVFADGKRWFSPAANVPEQNRYNQGARLVPVWDADAPIAGAVVI